MKIKTRFYIDIKIMSSQVTTLKDISNCLPNCECKRGDKQDFPDLLAANGDVSKLSRLLCNPFQVFDCSNVACNFSPSSSGSIGLWVGLVLFVLMMIIGVIGISRGNSGAGTGAIIAAIVVLIAGILIGAYAVPYFRT
jgi:hypothetical protein